MLQYMAQKILSTTRAAICTELGQHFSKQHPSFSPSLSLLITNSFASSSFLVINSLFCNSYHLYIHCAHRSFNVKIKLKMSFRRCFKGARSVLRLESISSEKSFWDLPNMWCVCFFDMERSNAQPVIADGEAADVLISADELFVYSL